VYWKYNFREFGSTLDDECVQQLYILIKELKYNNTINAKYLLDYLGENKAILELTDEQIIENIMGNDKEDNVKDDNSILELVSYKDTLKETIILH